MSTSTSPLKDRRGRVYTPAVGPRLRPLLWVILVGFALLGGQRRLPRERDGADLVARDHAADVLLHADDRSCTSPLGFAVVVPFLVFGFAHLAHVVEAAEQGGGTIRAGPPGLLAGDPDFGPGARPARRASRCATRGCGTSGYWLHVVTPLLAVGLYVKHRLAGPRIRWEWARRFGGVVAAFVAGDGACCTRKTRGRSA